MKAKTNTLRGAPICLCEGQNKHLKGSSNLSLWRPKRALKEKLHSLSDLSLYEHDRPTSSSYWFISREGDRCSHFQVGGGWASEWVCTFFIRKNPVFLVRIEALIPQPIFYAWTTHEQFFFVALRPNAAHVLLIPDVSISHIFDAPQSVEPLWTSDQLVAETSTCQHTTLTTDKHPCPRWDSNPRSQQASGRRTTP